MKLEVAMSVVDWFNPFSLSHLEAYKSLQKTGMWPKDFLPENIIFVTAWSMLLAFKLADCWVDSKLRE